MVVVCCSFFFFFDASSLKGRKIGDNSSRGKFCFSTGDKKPCEDYSVILRSGLISLRRWQGNKNNNIDQERKKFVCFLLDALVSLKGCSCGRQWLLVWKRTMFHTVSSTPPPPFCQVGRSLIINRLESYSLNYSFIENLFRESVFNSLIGFILIV